MATKLSLHKNYICEYHKQIEDGTVIVGTYVRQVYDYILQGLENQSFFYDHKKALKAINFIETFCHHSKGVLAPGLLTLELWQKAMLSCIFGLVDESGNRQFREVLIEIGRKCGKSLLASGIAEYMAYADGEYGADVYFLAPKLEQADIVCNDFWISVESEPDLAAITKSRKTDYYISQTNTSVKKLAFNQKKADGFNPHLTICDEIAAWPAESGLKQYEVMASALGSRRQPLIVSITTANYVNDGIYDELVKRATRVLEGESREKRLLPFLYRIDDVEKWNDMTELHKSLPNLGVSVSEEFIEEEIAKAEGSLSKKAEFLTKYCNIKQNSACAWLSAKDVNACFGDALIIDNFRSSYCLAGIDLSQTTDLTCGLVIIQQNGELYVFAKFWMPAGKIEELTERDGVPYELYRARGFLELSGENYIDYNDCYNWLVALVEEYEILPLQVGYDRYSAQYLIQDLTQYGFCCDDVYQGDNLWPVLQELEGWIRDRKVHMGDNDLLKIHLLNSAIKMNTERGRGKLVKIYPTDHIDGCAALVDAFCVRQKYWEELGDRLTNND